MSGDTLKALQHTADELEAVVRRMREKFWPTEAEIRARAWAEVQEELQPVPPPPPGRTPWWVPHFARNWGERRRRRRRRWSR